MRRSLRRHAIAVAGIFVGVLSNGRAMAQAVVWPATNTALEAEACLGAANAVSADVDPSLFATVNPTARSFDLLTESARFVQLDASGKPTAKRNDLLCYLSSRPGAADPTQSGASVRMFFGPNREALSLDASQSYWLEFEAEAVAIDPLAPVPASPVGYLHVNVSQHAGSTWTNDAERFYLGAARATYRVLLNAKSHAPGSDSNGHFDIVNATFSRWHSGNSNIRIRISDPRVRTEPSTPSVAKRPFAGASIQLAADGTWSKLDDANVMRPFVPRWLGFDPKDAINVGKRRVLDGYEPAPAGVPMADVPLDRGNLSHYRRAGYRYVASLGFNTVKLALTGPNSAPNGFQFAEAADARAEGLSYVVGVSAYVEDAGTLTPSSPRNFSLLPALPTPGPLAFWIDWEDHQANAFPQWADWDTFASAVARSNGVAGQRRFPILVNNGVMGRASALQSRADAVSGYHAEVIDSGSRLYAGNRVTEVSHEAHDGQALPSAMSVIGLYLNLMPQDEIAPTGTTSPYVATTEADAASRLTSLNWDALASGAKGFHWFNASQDVSGAMCGDANITFATYEACALLRQFPLVEFSLRNFNAHVEALSAFVTAKKAAFSPVEGPLGPKHFSMIGKTIDGVHYLLVSNAQPEARTATIVFGDGLRPIRLEPLALGSLTRTEGDAIESPTPASGSATFDLTIGAYSAKMYRVVTADTCPWLANTWTLTGAGSNKTSSAVVSVNASGLFSLSNKTNRKIEVGISANAPIRKEGSRVPLQQDDGAYLRTLGTGAIADFTDVSVSCATRLTFTMSGAGVIRGNAGTESASGASITFTRE